MPAQGRGYSPSPFLRFGIPLSLLLLAFAVRAIGLSAQSLWYDEGYTVLFAKHDLAYLLTQTARLELNTPLHYMVLHGWMAAAGDSEFVVRLFSVFAGVGTVVLAGALARFVVPSSVATPPLAMAFVALWPVCVALSQEVRMYGLLICLSILSVVVLMSSLRSSGIGASGWLIWGLCNLAAFATHVLAALIFGAQAVALMVWWLSRPREQRPALAVFTAIATGALMVLWIIYIVGNAASYGTTYTAKLDYLSVLEQSLASNLLPELQPVELVLPASVACVALLVLLVLLGRKLWRFALIPALSIVAIGAFSAFTGKFAPRYTAVTAPLIATTLGIVGTGLLKRSRRRRLIFPITSIVTILSLGSCALLCIVGIIRLRNDPRYANEDFRGASVFIRQHIRADETVLLDSGHLWPVFQYYYGVGGWSAIPPDPVLNVRHTLDYDTAVPLMNQALDGKRGAWLLLWQDDIIDPSGIVPTLLQRVAHELTHDQDVTRYQGLRLLHFRFDEPYMPLPESIPYMTSTVELAGSERGLSGIGCYQFRIPHAGEPAMEVACFWQVQPFVQMPSPSLPYDTRVSLRLFGPGDKLITQNDMMIAPVRGIPSVPFTKPITSFYFVTLPGNLGAGNYTLRAIPYTDKEELSPRLVTPVSVLP